MIADYCECEPPCESALTLAYYQEMLAEHRKLVRELDVAINGDGAARQASLCDIVAQVKSGHFKLVRERD